MVIKYFCQARLFSGCALLPPNVLPNRSIVMHHNAKVACPNFRKKLNISLALCVTVTFITVLLISNCSEF